MLACSSKLREIDLGANPALLKTNIIFGMNADKACEHTVYYQKCYKSSDKIWFENLYYEYSSCCLLAVIG